MTSKPKDNLFQESTMTFGEHLEELRVVLFRSLVGLVIGFLLGLFVAKYVVLWIQTPLKAALAEHYETQAEDRLNNLYGEDLDENVMAFMKNSDLVYEDVYLERNELDRIRSMTGPEPADVPLDDSDSAENNDPAEDALDDLSAADAESSIPELVAEKLPLPSADMIQTRIWRKVRTDVTALNAQESFMIWLKAAFAAGLLIASPYIFFQIWSFVAAGLYSHEKRYVYMFVPISLGLFWSGAALAFFFAFKYVLNFLFGFNRLLDIQTDLRISEWMGFVLFLPLGFGVAFQLPLVMLFLNRIGIFSIKSYIEKWRIAILVIAVLSMLLTPADPISMLLMGGPLVLLYFLGIAMAMWMPKGRNPFSEGYEA